MHTHRPRRSALRQPALVDPSDLPDDAPGRVEVFWIPPLDPEAPTPPPAANSRLWRATVEALVSDLAPLVLGLVLVNLLWVGLVLTH